VGVNACGRVLAGTRAGSSSHDGRIRRGHRMQLFFVASNSYYAYSICVTQNELILDDGTLLLDVKQLSRTDFPKLQSSLSCVVCFSQLFLLYTDSV
jgi:hypothetical protein